MEWSIKTASKAVGGLSNPSKMPSLGTSLPAQACPIGSKLVSVKGSVCEGCYALKGSYSWDNVKTALRRRLTVLRECETDPEARERWISAMSYLLNERFRLGSYKRAANLMRRAYGFKPKPLANDSRYFRWHDSGDVQGLWHLAMIVEVARRTPDVRHWLPTRELPTVRAFLADKPDGFPSNLNVRVSANKVGAPIPSIRGCTGSGVHTVKGAPENRGRECPAIYQENACGDCRRCWDRNEPEVSYLLH